MLQMDFFEKNGTDYLYHEIQKIQNSMDRQRKAMFAMLTEIQEEVIKLKEKNEYL